MPDDLELEQKQLFKGRSRFTLNGSRSLRIRFGKGGKTSEHTVNLSTLDPACVNTRSSAVTSWVALWFFLAIHLAAMVAIWVGMARDPLASRLGICAMASTILILPPIAAAVRAVRLSYNITIFYYWNGQVAFTVANLVPTSEAATAFIKELTTRIEKASPLPTAGNAFTDQLAQLDALRTRGVLTEEEFSTAKQRVLASAGGEGKRIGFC